jgi:hypothetical protein
MGTKHSGVQLGLTAGVMEPQGNVQVKRGFLILSFSSLEVKHTPCWFEFQLHFHSGIRACRHKLHFPKVWV